VLLNVLNLSRGIEGQWISARLSSIEYARPQHFTTSCLSKFIQYKIARKYEELLPGLDIDRISHLQSCHNFLCPAEDHGTREAPMTDDAAVLQVCIANQENDFDFLPSRGG
jgi:hypothetical protein